MRCVTKPLTSSGFDNHWLMVLHPNCLVSLCIEQSVFWRMINEENGKMFGVFNPVERQIIHDWIAAVFNLIHL
jgi:hypothetical protein